MSALIVTKSNAKIRNLDYCDFHSPSFSGLGADAAIKRRNFLQELRKSIRETLRTICRDLYAEHNLYIGDDEAKWFDVRYTQVIFYVKPNDVPYAIEPDMFVTDFIHRANWSGSYSHRPSYYSLHRAIQSYKTLLENEIARLGSFIIHGIEIDRKAMEILEKDTKELEHIQLPHVRRETLFWPSRILKSFFTPENVLE